MPFHTRVRAVAPLVAAPLAISAVLLTVPQLLPSSSARLAAQTAATSSPTAAPTAAPTPATGIVRFCNDSGHPMKVTVAGAQVRSDTLRTGYCTDDIEDWAPLPAGRYQLDFMPLAKRTELPDRFAAEIRRLKHRVINVDVTKNRRVKLHLHRGSTVKVSIYPGPAPATEGS